MTIEYRHLAKGEIIQAGDETDRCVDPWRDPAKWEPVHPNSIGDPAPDPQYVSHRLFRRPVSQATACYQTFDCNAGDHSDACPAKE